VLSLGEIAVYGLSFARNLILARILTKTDFGLAAALSVGISLLELVGRMAFGKQIIQNREGNDPRFQSVAHSVQSIVGVASALLVLASAYPMAAVFGVPELAWAFASLALIPLARGTIHLDLMRLQRQYIFGPGLLMEVVPQGLATMAAWPLAVWMGDFRAVLWIMLGKELLTVAMSHLLAERPYKWAWDMNHVKQMLAFGWPLLFNGFVIFTSQQGDQMLIGTTFSLADLGSYSIAFSLSVVPFFIFGQVASSLMLPMLSRHQDDPGVFQRYYLRCVELSVLGGLLVLGPLVVAGEPVVRLLYGPKYSGVGTLMAVFGAIAALRFLRWAPAVAAMARADTINHLIGNIARAVSLPLALLLVALGVRDVVMVALCGMVGEILSILVSVVRVRMRQGIRLRVHTTAFLFLAGWIMVGATANRFLGDGSSIWQAGAAVLVLWSMGAVAASFLFPNLMILYRRTLADLHIPAIFSGR